MLASRFDLTPYGYDGRDGAPGSSRSWGNRFRDSSPWRDILSEGGRRSMVNSGLERNVMGIDDLRSFRADAIPMMLGNKGGGWSTVKLAEAFSRLATGRAVRATFVDRRGRPERADGGFGVERLAVTRGMARVLEGTAASSRAPGAVFRLTRDLARRSFELGVFAKTGTMQLAGRTALGCGARARTEACVGKAFVVTLAIYPAAGAVVDPRTRRVADGSAVPRCAITVAVNLPQWNDEPLPGNAAANLAADLIDGVVGARLREVDGGFCARRD